MTQPFNQLLLATGNPGKVRELAALLEPAAIPFLTPAQAALKLEVAETGDDYEANARKKALAFARASGQWALADDSGLEVEPLEGAPGLHSARLAGAGASDADRRQKLMRLLADIPQPWPAQFRCTMALASPDGIHHVTMGLCPGEIVPQPRGEGGFGYDPIFQVAGTKLTMAQLGIEQKNRISHRARALQAMLPVLRQLAASRNR
jgi:XTP/dITP diphosphohydrolase